MKKFGKRILPIATLAVSAGLLAACSAPGGSATPVGSPTPEESSVGASFDEAALLEEALQEGGTFTLYTAQGGAVSDQVIEQFRAAYPQISSDMLRITSAQLAGRFSGENAAGVHIADAFITSSTDIFDQEPELFQELVPGDETLGPNFVAWPKENIQGPYLSFSIAPHVIIYNTDMLSEKDLPDTWEGLVDMDLSKAAFLDPRAGDSFLSFAKFLRDEYGDGYLEKIAASGATFLDSGVTAAQGVAAGEYSLTVPGSVSNLVSLLADGAPIAFKTVDPVHAPKIVVGIPAKPAHPAAAKLFFNWFLSETQQAANCAGSNAPLGGVEFDDCIAVPDAYAPMTASRDIPNYEKDIIVGLLGLS